MKLNQVQLEHLSSLRVADAVRERDKATRREWKWRPHLAGPVINSRVLEALSRRKLVRWLPGYGEDIPVLGGCYRITNEGKKVYANLFGQS